MANYVKLDNVHYSSGRIVSDNPALPTNIQRGVNTRGRFTKIISNRFGSGTVKATIHDKKFYMDRASCFNLILAAGKTTSTKKEYLANKTDKEIAEEVKKVFEECMNPVDDSPIGKWLGKFQNQYLSHVTETMGPTILKAGKLKPAEMILREGKEVDFEAGNNPSEVNFGRGTAQLPKLTETELDSLQEILFSKKDQARLDTLLADRPKLLDGRIKYKEFSKFRKEYLNEQPASPFDPKPNAAKYARELKKIKADEDVKWYLEAIELQRRSSGLRALFGFHIDKLDDQWSLKFDAMKKNELNTVIEKLTDKYHCDEREILISFDLAQRKHKQLDTYLRQKVRKGNNENIMMSVRADVLKYKKLNPEIRMGQNFIAWAYGSTVFLFGGEEGNIRESLPGGEAIMKSPLSGDDFFSLNLKKHKNLIILGPKSKLEKFKDTYGDRIVYLEDLTYNQKVALNVPTSLR